MFWKFVIEELRGIRRELRDLRYMLFTVISKENQEMLDLTNLTNEVQQNTDAVASASTLLGTLAQELRDAAGDPAAVQALADQLDQNNSALAAAVTANTPADTSGGSTDTGGGTTDTGGGTTP